MGAPKFRNRFPEGGGKGGYSESWYTQNMPEEFLDVLDSNGSPTGVAKPRSEIHKAGDWHRAVHVWIINGQGELLVQKRSLNKESNPNKWDISVAGHLSAGETSGATALKEIKEEMGLVVSKAKLQLLFRLTQQKVLNNGTYLNNEFNDVYLLKHDLDSSQAKFQVEEISEIKWIKVSELERVLQEQDQNYVQHDEEYAELIKFLRKN